MNQQETALSVKANNLDSRESELRRLRRALDADRAHLDGAKEACLERERGLAVMEEGLRDREAEVTEVEVRRFSTCSINLGLLKQFILWCTIVSTAKAVLACCPNPNRNHGGECLKQLFWASIPVVLTSADVSGRLLVLSRPDCAVKMRRWIMPGRCWRLLGKMPRTMLEWLIKPTRRRGN